MTIRVGAAWRWLTGVIFAAGCLPSPDISAADLTPQKTPAGPVDSSSCADSYPDDSQLGRDVGTVIDPTLSLVDEHGRYTLRSLYEPCQKPARLLVLRLTTAWCGPCQWQAAHTRELLQSDIGNRLQLIDVVLQNSQNRQAAVADLAELKGSYDQLPQLAISDVPARLTNYCGLSAMPVN